MYFSRVTLNPELASTALTDIILQQPYNKHKLFWELFPGRQQRCFLYREEFADEQLDSRSRLRGAFVFYLVSAVAPASHPIFQIETKSYEPKIHDGERLAFRLRVNPTVSRDGRRHDVVMDVQSRYLAEIARDAGLQVTPGNRGKLSKKCYKAAILAAASPDIDSRLRQLIHDSPRYQEGLAYAGGRRELLEWALKSLGDQALYDWLAKRSETCGFRLVSSSRQLAIGRYDRHMLPEKGEKAEFRSVDLAGELEVTDQGVFVSQTLFQGIGKAKAFGCGLMMVRRI